MSFSTRELSIDTWPDFTRLFAAGTGWGFCACMLYQRGCHLNARDFPRRAESLIENQRQKRELVESGQAHGVLVYDAADVDPVGWCQFGPADELPLANASILRLDRRIPPLAADVEWRITCFVTARGHRRQGVARAALRGALDAIDRRGGGVVEGYPTTTPSNGNWQHAGTLSLFESEGFVIHGRPDAQPYVVVRQAI